MAIWETEPVPASRRNSRPANPAFGVGGSPDDFLARANHCDWHPLIGEVNLRRDFEWSRSWDAVDPQRAGLRSTRIPQTGLSSADFQWASGRRMDAIGPSHSIVGRQRLPLWIDARSITWIGSVTLANLCG